MQIANLLTNFINIQITDYSLCLFSLFLTAHSKVVQKLNEQFDPFFVPKQKLVQNNQKCTLFQNSILTKHFHEFSPNFFDNFSREIKVVNSCPKLQHFHEFFTNFICDIFSREMKIVIS